MDNKNKEIVIKYYIHGIYGDVRYVKYCNLEKMSNIRIFKLNEKMSYNSNYKIWYDAEIRDANTYETIDSAEYIEGLPEDLTEEQYFRMACLEQIKDFRACLEQNKNLRNVCLDAEQLNELSKTIFMANGAQLKANE